MNIHDQILANRYAAAFLNRYVDTITIEDYFHIKNAYDFLHNHREILIYFKLPRVEEEKQEALKKLFTEFNLPESLHKLIDLLSKHQRLFLLKNVFYALLEIYCKRKGLIEFNVQSSHQLNGEQLDAIKKFLEKKTKRSILYNKTINKNLIAGIRLLSNELLWEHSVAQQLRKAEQFLRSKERS